MRRDSLMNVINISINQTLGRTVLTAGLTLLSVLALFIFGGEVLRGFAFTMIVGIITGTYSSVFVAAAIVTFWHRKTPKAQVTAAETTSTQPTRRGQGPTRAAAHAPATAAVSAGAPQQPTRKSKPQRKARAS